MILYTPKVSSEHLEDDVGTSVNHHRNDPKVTYLINTHVQITDKKCKIYAYRARTRYARGLRNQVYHLYLYRFFMVSFHYVN